MSQLRTKMRALASAFTLVELLAVLVVLGIIITMAITFVNGRAKDEEAEPEVFHLIEDGKVLSYQEDYNLSLDDILAEFNYNHVRAATYGDGQLVFVLEHGVVIKYEKRRGVWYYYERIPEIDSETEVSE